MRRMKGMDEKRIGTKKQGSVVVHSGNVVYNGMNWNYGLEKGDYL